MRRTHAIVIRIPATLKLDKKLKADVDLMRKQQEDLTETLRESGANIIELGPQENVGPNSLYADDTAVIINGTALICRPKKDGARLEEMSRVLGEFCWSVVECPSTLNNKTVVLEGSDVLFTGKEVFVGIRKHGTNTEGAIILGRVFCDVPIIPIYLSDKAQPLKYYVSLAGENILSVGNSKEAQNIVKRMEQQATFRYQILRIEDEAAVNCICVNGRIVFRQDTHDPKFTSLQSTGLELWALDVSELIKAGAPFSRYCLLFQQV